MEILRSPPPANETLGGIPARGLRAHRRLARGAIVLAGFLACLGLSFSFDDAMVRFLAQPIRSGQIKAVLASLRSWGEASTLVIVGIGIVCVQPRLWRAMLAIALSALVCSSTADGLKNWFARPRPSEALAVESGSAASAAYPRNSSFPSGHAATAFAVARGLTWYIPALYPAAILAACGTALSRMFEQRHYLSDCIAGAGLGWFITTLVLHSLDRWIRGFGRSKVAGPRSGGAAERLAKAG